MKKALYVIGIGLLVGVVARILLPGVDPMGWFGTLIVGVLGSLLGGWISKKVGKPVTQGKLDWKSFGFMVLGAVILLIVIRMLF
ncbi:MAG: GlsB/YeaQ/YmgE family stress response membrane protein [bacterium]|nr:GlsB/YeaQ/YmgE family stress response membrane protein [bacterium]